MADVGMPRLSDSMEEGTVLRWLKQPGDEVAVGDELVEIETDKANMVFEADVAGTLTELVAAEGDVVAVGAPIARIGAPGEAQSANGSGAAPAAAEPATSVEAALAPARASTGGGRIIASPVARRIASELGLDLATVRGSGPGGRIVKADVEAAAGGAPAAAAPTSAELAPAGASGAVAAAAATAPPTPPAATGKGDVEVVQLTKLQQTVAQRMALSKATAPHFQLQANVDMTRCAEARAELKALAGDAPAPSLNDFVVKACAIALREHPHANGAYKDGTWELYSRVNVGIAVAADAGLVVPTILDADRKGLAQISREARELAARVRDGRITPPELASGTFTVSNLGMFGIVSFQPVINAPQAAILAVGAVTPTPVVRDGGVAIASLMSLTLACDHRILDGADGARFLGRVRDLLERPAGLAL